MIVIMNINVTKPSLPDIEDLIPYLKQIWDSQILTNNGPLVNELEKSLSQILGISNLSLFNNGTIALQCAMKALNLTGEVITTPYSFVATSHAIIWNDLSPIFVDIEKTSLNIDPDKIEAAITPTTSAILGVHTYGMPCEFKAIDQIAKRHNLKVIYDAAHAFGVVDNSNQSVLQFGDVSIVSLHATKIFNTFEGGAVITNNSQLHNRIKKIRNFGFESETSIIDIGTNGKMSELNAAVGLCQIKNISKNYLARAHNNALYNNLLKKNSHIEICAINQNSKSNFSYYPILIKNQNLRDPLYDYLKKIGINTRRYFYPLISNLSMYNHYASAKNLPVANQIANQVLCLPMYSDLNDESIIYICKNINEFLA